MARVSLVIIIAVLVLAVGLLFIGSQFLEEPRTIAYVVNPVAELPEIDALETLPASPEIETNPFYENPFT